MIKKPSYETPNTQNVFSPKPALTKKLGIHEERKTFGSTS